MLALFERIGLRILLLSDKEYGLLDGEGNGEGVGIVGLAIAYTIMVI